MGRKRDSPPWTTTASSSGSIHGSETTRPMESPPPSTLLMLSSPTRWILLLSTGLSALASCSCCICHFFLSMCAGGVILATSGHNIRDDHILDMTAPDPINHPRALRMGISPGRENVFQRSRSMCLICSPLMTMMMTKIIMMTPRARFDKISFSLDLQPF